MADEEEAAVGIVAFVNKAAGFSGILKQRFSDFIVREVSRDGTVVRLHSIDGSALQEQYFPSALPTDESPLEPETECDRILKHLRELPDAVDAVSVLNIEDFRSFLLKTMQKDEDCASDFIALPGLTKSSRTAVHGLFKGPISKFIDTATVQQAQEKESNTNSAAMVTYMRFIAMHKQKNGAGGGRQQQQHKRRRPAWPEELSDRRYLQFSLLKENVDTLSAIDILAKALHCNSNAIETYGTKDKRAVTVQRCTMFQRRPAEFNSINASSYSPLIYVGDFEYVSEGAKLGHAAGNRFEIILRAIDTPDTDVIASCEQLQRGGFINYFGLQRFGKGGSKSHEIGRQIYKSQWRDCVDMLFASRDGDREQVVQAKADYFAGQYQAAHDALPARMHTERCVLRRLIQNSDDFFNAFSSMPKNVRLIYVHAYQSYIWNCAVTHRLQNHGMNIIVGDIVALHDIDQSEEYLSSTPAEGNDSNSKKRQKIDASADGMQHSLKSTDKHDIHIVDENDIAQGKYSLRNVVLPLLGSDSVLPKNSTGDYIEQLLSVDGITISSFAQCNITYRTSGAYRRLLQFPNDFQWKLIKYGDDNEELAVTELSDLRPWKPNEAIKSNIDAAEECKTTLTTAAASSGHGEERTALQLEFTLPPGTYATMLLRELTKRSTETRYQAELTNTINRQGAKE